MRVHIKIQRIIVIPTLLLFVFGCALTSSTSPYDEMPADNPWQNYSGESRIAETKEVEGLLTIEKAISIALANNPESAAVEHEWEALQFQSKVAGSQRWPSFHVVGGYGHFLNSQRLIPAQENGEVGVFSQDIFTSDLVVRMPLYTGGRITQEIKATELLQQAAQHRLTRTNEELVFNVSSVFYNILAQRLVIESLEFSLNTLEKHLKRVQELIDLQKAAKVDWLRTNVRLSDLEQRLVYERNILAIQLRILTNFMGLDYSEKPVDPSGELAMSEGNIADVKTSLQIAFENRSDYQAARATLEAIAKGVDIAKAERLPEIFVQGSYGGRWATSATDVPSGTDQFGDVGGVAVVIDIPIFEGGKIKARIQQERARLMAAQARLRKLEFQIQLDVETALLNIGSAEERVKTNGKAVEQAKESLRIEREKYDLGKGVIVDVLDAQSALLQSETNYAQSLADLAVAHAGLKLSIGRTVE